MTNTTTYVTFSPSELYKINFDQVLETGPETCRRSIDGSQVLIKWLGHPPSCVLDVLNKSQFMTHEQVLELMTTSEWAPPQIDPGTL
jgi:hypothetical protein